MRIYIAGPYGARNGACGATLEANVGRAVEAARALVLKGHNPMCPHLYHYIDRLPDGGKLTDEDTWLAICMQWVQFCEAILMLPGWENSTGAKQEHALAMKLRMSVYYHIGDVPGLGMITPELGNIITSCP